MLVTGATGFVGTALCRALVARGVSVRRAVRHRDALTALENDFVTGDFGPDTEWNLALRGIDTAIHLAARTHVMRDAASDPIAEYRRANVLPTIALALAAINAGVQRFNFLSSIKVNVEKTGAQPFTERDVPRSEDAYGQSKWETEQVLVEIAAGSNM